MAKIKQQGQIWAHLSKEYIKCEWTSDTKIYMADVQGGYHLDHKSILPNSPFWISYYLLKTSQIRYTAS